MNVLEKPRIPAPRLEKRRLIRHWLQAIAVCALFAALHGGRPLWLGLVPPDERLGHMPNGLFSLQCFQQGILPLWNPYTFCGLPHLASHQAMAAYPPVYLFFSLFEPFRAFSLMQGFHYFWIGLGTWALLRFSWRLRQGAALAGGIFFMLSGFTMAHEGHSPMLFAVTWIPWILLFSQRAISGKPLAAPMLAAALAFQGGAGAMQIVVLTSFVTTAEALVLTFRNPSPKALRRFLIWSFAMALGLGLMAVQFVSTREMLPTTFRGAITYDAFTTHGFPLAQLPTLFFPELFGVSWPTPLIKQPYFSALTQPEMIVSMGAAAWVAVLLFFSFRPRVLRPGLRPRVFFWAGMAIFATLLLLGSRSPLNLLLYKIPVLNMFRVQNRWMVFADLALAIFAAIGIDRALGTIGRRQPLRLGRALTIGFLLLALSIPITYAWIALLSPFDDPANFLMSWPWFFGDWFRLTNPALWLPLAFGLAALLVLLLLWKRPQYSKLCIALWGGLYALQQGNLCSEVTARTVTPAADYYPPLSGTVDWLLKNAGDPADYRIFTPTADDVRILQEESLHFNLPQLNGIYSATGNWPLMSPVFLKLLRMGNIGSTDDPVGLLNHPAILNMLNIRYLILGYYYDGLHPAPYRPGMPDPGLVTLMRDKHRYPWLRERYQSPKGMMIFENATALPRAWTVDTLIPCRDTNDIIAHLWNDRSTVDPAREAYVLPDLSLTQIQKLTQGAVRFTERRADRLRLEVSAPNGPTFLVISEPMHPGWWARLDGKLVPIYTVNALLRGIYVPQGTHQLYLRYLPAGFVLGLKISAVCAILWLIWLIVATRLRVARFRRNRHPDT